MGEGFTWETQDRARDIAARARRLGGSPSDDRRSSYQMVLLDELNIVLRYDYLPLEEVLEVLRDGSRPTSTSSSPAATPARS